jgi:hypothetical protein
MLGRAFFHAGRMLRETGQALDRLGLRAQNNNIFREKRTRAERSRAPARPPFSAPAEKGITGYAPSRSCRAPRLRTAQ